MIAHVSVAGAWFTLPLQVTFRRWLLKRYSTSSIIARRNELFLSFILLFYLFFFLLLRNCQLFMKLRQIIWNFCVDIFTCLTIQHPSVWPINWACLGSVCDGLQSTVIIYFIIYLHMLQMLVRLCFLLPQLTHFRGTTIKQPWLRICCRNVSMYISKHSVIC